MGSLLSASAVRRGVRAKRLDALKLLRRSAMNLEVDSKPGFLKEVGVRFSSSEYRLIVRLSESAFLMPFGHQS